MLCLVQVKGCKRCGGDLSLECDIYGVYAECIQCGANWTKREMIVPAAKKSAKKPVAKPGKSIMVTIRR